MEDEYQRERRDQGTEASEEGLGVLRALPVRPEPRQAREQCEHAEAPGSRRVSRQARPPRAVQGRRRGRPPAQRGAWRRRWSRAAAVRRRSARRDSPGERRATPASMARPSPGRGASPLSGRFSHPRHCCQPQSHRVENPVACHDGAERRATLRSCRAIERSESDDPDEHTDATPCPRWHGARAIAAGCSESGMTTRTRRVARRARRPAPRGTDRRSGPPDAPFSSSSSPAGSRQLSDGNVASSGLGCRPPRTARAARGRGPSRSPW